MVEEISITSRVSTSASDNRRLSTDSKHLKQPRKYSQRPDEKRPLKICLLSYRSDPHCGGQGVYIKNLSRALRDSGHSVDVVSGPPDLHIDDDIKVYPLKGLDLYNPENLFRVPSLKELSDPVNMMEWLGVSTMGFPEPFTFGRRAFKFLRKRIGRYDIVHDNQSLSYGVRNIGRFLPTIATIHHPITVDRVLAVRAGSSFCNKIKQMRWYSFIGMQKRVAKTFSNIITVSQCSAHDISNEFKIPPDRFRIVPNGIDTTRFYPIPEIKRESNRIIVTNSADTPLKGLHYLLKAIYLISKTHKAKLVVVGVPKKNGSILKLIRNLGIGNLISFTGRIDHKEYVEQYARAAIAVVPSVYEGFGLPAGEAMSCAIPVISTTGGALPEVVGSAGVLIPPQDSSALARAIIHLLEHPDRAYKIGQAGYKRVQDNFTWERAAKKTVNAYRKAILDYHRLQ